jgi:hypothetical protein
MQRIKIEIARLTVQDDKTVMVGLDTAVIGLSFNEIRVRGLTPEQAVAVKTVMNQAFLLGFQQARAEIRDALDITTPPEIY